MPNARISGGFDFITILKGGGTTTFNEDVLGVVGTKEEMAVVWKDFIQNELDVRQKLNTVPTDDVFRTTDPARPDFFWDPSAIDGGGSPGQTDLVARVDTVDWVVWDTDEQVYRVRVKRTGT